MGSTSSLWIVHRDPRIRSGLVRLVGAGEDAIVGAPGDPLFDAAPAADAVLLGLVGDFEAELQFAHRHAGRLQRARWILLVERREEERARLLFDTLDADLLTYPDDAQELRRAVREPRPPQAEAPLPLSQRPFRDALRDRFARWFADLESAEMMRALDPRLADIPFLICGEPGTGRALLARYAHTYGGSLPGAFAHLTCTRHATAASLAEALARAARGPRSRSACTVWLEDLDRLPPETQHQVESWIEFGPPEGVLQTGNVRWIASARDEQALEPGLRRVFGGLQLRLPPLRERPQRIARFANETSRIWCGAHGLSPCRFGEDALAVLEEYPWPGNLRELETVVIQTLAAGASDPVRSDDLRYDGRAFAPLGLGSTGPPAAPSEPRDWSLPLAELEEEAAGKAEPEAVAEPGAGGEAEPEEFVEAVLEDASPLGEAGLRRLAGAVAHEIRNPLATIHSYAQLLPEHDAEPEFRANFAALVSRDVRRISDVLDELSRLAALGPPARERVDLTALLEELLRERREGIHARRLVVLRELEREHPEALGDAGQLRLAFQSLLDKALELLPDRGRLFVASKHHGAVLRGGPSLRVLVRLQGGGEGETSPAENALAFVAAELVVRAQGGTLTVDAGERESVLVVDLPAPD